MAKKFLTSSNNAAGVYDSTAYSMIKTAVSAASINSGFQLSDNREVFDRLCFNIDDSVSVNGKTSASAFDSSSDVASIRASSVLVSDLNASSYILSIAAASSVMSNFYSNRAMYISTASYDSVSFSVASQEGTPQALAFSLDGTKMFVLGNAYDTVYQYTLSTAYDVSTASYDSVSFRVASQEGTPQALAFSLDGTKMFVLGNVNDTVYQYTLSTAYDVSTASYDSVSFSVASQEGTPTALAFSLDGTKMFVLGTSNVAVYQYTLSTAYDVSTASYDSVSFSVASQNGAPQALAFSLDGTKMFVLGISNVAVYQYTLSTPYDVSTASYDSVSFSVASQEGAPQALAFSLDGTKMFVVGYVYDTVYQYSGDPMPGGVIYGA